MCYKRFSKPCNKCASFPVKSPSGAVTLYWVFLLRGSIKRSGKNISLFFVSKPIHHWRVSKVLHYEEINSITLVNGVAVAVEVKIILNARDSFY